MREHSPRLLASLRSYATADADAHDLLQETWLRAYRKRGTYEGRGSFAGWLLMVARSVGVNAVSARNTRFVQQYADIAVDPDADSALLRTILYDAVLTLPPRQRDVVLMRLMEGLSTAETAYRLDCAQGTVKATLHHAIHKLQTLLKEKVR